MVPILYELMLFLVSNALYTSALIHHQRIRHIRHLLTSVIPLQLHTYLHLTYLAYVVKKLLYNRTKLT